MTKRGCCIEWEKRNLTNVPASNVSQYIKNDIYPPSAAFAPALAAFGFVLVIATARIELLATQARRPLISARKKQNKCQIQKKKRKD